MFFVFRLNVFLVLFVFIFFFVNYFKYFGKESGGKIIKYRDGVFFSIFIKWEKDFSNNFVIILFYDGKKWVKFIKFLNICDYFIGRDKI